MWVAICFCIMKHLSIWVNPATQASYPSHPLRVGTMKGKQMCHAVHWLCVHDLVMTLYMAEGY